jgi:lipoprotein-releasing system ATP-binding protein
MNDVVLSLKNVVKSYNTGQPNQLDVLRGVNLDLRQSQTTALVAPSGAGKSTLLHIAGLLDTPETGEIVLQGRPMHDLNDAERTLARRQEIGFVYQFHHLLPEFTALENIVLPQLANAVSEKQARAHAIELMDIVGVAPRATHRPAELSGGEQQRVAFCRALANRPSVLLADEPTGNLDQETSEQVFSALLDLVRETGLSAFIATHNNDLAYRMTHTMRLSQGIIDEIERISQ